MLGLLALMLLQESRRPAGPHQLVDRAAGRSETAGLWNQQQIAEGLARVERALASHFGSYTLQAAIAAVHAQAKTPPKPSGRKSSAYTICLPVLSPRRLCSSTGQSLLRSGPAAGLGLIDAILESGELADISLAHSARAGLCRRLGRVAEARAGFHGRWSSSVRSREHLFLAAGLSRLSELASYGEKRRIISCAIWMGRRNDYLMFQVISFRTTQPARQASTSAANPGG